MMPYTQLARQTQHLQSFAWLEEPTSVVSKESIVIPSGVTSIKNSTFGLLKLNGAPCGLSWAFVVPLPAALLLELVLFSGAFVGGAVLVVSEVVLCVLGGIKGRTLRISTGNDCTLMAALGKNGTPTNPGWTDIVGLFVGIAFEFVVAAEVVFVDGAAAAVVAVVDVFGSSGVVPAFVVGGLTRSAERFICAWIIVDCLIN